MLGFRLCSSLGSRQAAELCSLCRPSFGEFVPGAALAVTCISGNPCLQPPAVHVDSSPLQQPRARLCVVSAGTMGMLLPQAPLSWLTSELHAGDCHL